ncbi:MAG TPA: ATP synthase F1 subunit delta [Thermoanaerobaculia bacterium]|jgi:F-type H+-transporting ATPase subunit delta|nr:ATP synthase F1 subunit delta [Thermoanaerobaculia bacterium]
MANVDDRDLEVGRLYAEAILALAESKGQADALLDEFRELVEFLDQNPKVEHFLSSPLVDEEARTRVIESLFRGKASDLLADALQVINRKGRLGSLRAIAQSYRTALRELHGWMDVHVRTAVPLSDALRQRLVDTLAASTRRRPALIEKVDPSMIGGLVIEIEGRKFDASVASRLQDLSESLLARASREIHRGGVYVAES